MDWHFLECFKCFKTLQNTYSAILRRFLGVYWKKSDCKTKYGSFWKFPPLQQHQTNEICLIIIPSLRSLPTFLCIIFLNIFGLSSVVFRKICRCVSLHHIHRGAKCAMQTITAVPASGMARKRSYHLQPRCWNEHRWFNFSSEFQTALLNWLCKARKEVVASLPNFLCILISKSLSNLKLKYTTVFKQKRIHNCITHSKVSRNTTFHNYRRLLNHSQYARSFNMMYCVRHAVATTSILHWFDDC